jgi:hypothetical protein
MEKMFMKRLKRIIADQCQKEFNYVGIVEGKDKIRINTGNVNDVIIEIVINK